MRSDLVQAIGELVKSGKTDEGDGISVTVPGLHVDNIYPIFKSYFNDAALFALSKPAHGLIHVREQVVITPGLGNLLKKLGLKSCQELEHGYCRRLIDRVQFCASRADRKNVHKAVEKVILTVNDLASRGYVTATLMPLGMFALAPTTSPEVEYVVISYVALTDDGRTYAAQNMPKMWVDDGVTPERFENQ